MEPDDITALESANTQNAEIVSILGSFQKRVSKIYVEVFTCYLNFIVWSVTTNN